MMIGYDVVTVSTKTSRLRAFFRGRGHCLVLLPGIGRPPDDLLPLATRLVEAGYAVLLPEPRGIGLSRGPLEGITLHDLAEDVAAAIEACGERSVSVIGHAFGNRIARTLAADRPDVV